MVKCAVAARCDMRHNQHRKLFSFFFQLLRPATNFSYTSHLEVELGFVRCGRYIRSTNGMAVRSIKGSYPMKTKIIAAVAALAFALTAGSALARNVQDNCANINADSAAYSTADVKLCQ